MPIERFNCTGLKLSRCVKFVTAVPRLASAIGLVVVSADLQKSRFQQRYARLVRYLFVGGIAWLADVSVFLLCMEGLGIAGAQLCARATGAVVAFVGHKLVVFGDHRAQAATLARQSLAYGGLAVFAYGVSAWSLIILIEQVRVHPVVAKLLVEVGVVTMNYLVMKNWIFAAVREKGAQE